MKGATSRIYYPDTLLKPFVFEKREHKLNSSQEYARCHILVSVALLVTTVILSFIFWLRPYAHCGIIFTGCAGASLLYFLLSIFQEKKINGKMVHYQAQTSGRDVSFTKIYQFLLSQDYTQDEKAPLIHTMDQQQLADFIKYCNSVPRTNDKILPMFALINTHEKWTLVKSELEQIELLRDFVEAIHQNTTPVKRSSLDNTFVPLTQPTMTTEKRRNTIVEFNKTMLEVFISYLHKFPIKTERDRNLHFEIFGFIRENQFWNVVKIELREKSDEMSLYIGNIENASFIPITEHTMTSEERRQKLSDLMQ